MRFGVVLLLLMAATTGCAPTPAPQASGPTPLPRLTGKESEGQKATLAYQYCTAEGARLCGAYTIYCDSYRREHLKVCMTSIGVSPEYTFMLMSR